jgi:phosphomevalonate kinase
MKNMPRRVNRVSVLPVWNDTFAVSHLPETPRFLDILSARSANILVRSTGLYFDAGQMCADLYKHRPPLPKNIIASHCVFLKYQQRRRAGSTITGMIREVRVPGNLLLCGEYAITCPGGLGVALALSPVLTLRISPAAAFSFSGSAGSLRLDGTGLVRAALSAVAEKFGLRNDAAPAYALSADSGAFYAADGRKHGYGSSAALAVALVTALLAGFGVLEERDPARGRASVAKLALEAHRRYQGGGSGYDVYASVYGGLGLFTGGAEPAWEAVPLAGLPRPLYLIRGGETARTKDAVEDFASWRAREPAAAKRFLRGSNKACTALAGSIRKSAPLSDGSGAMFPSPAFVQALEAARVIGCLQGRALGRDPEPNSPLESPLARVRGQGCIAKASGAGGELAFAFKTSASYTSAGSVRDSTDAPGGALQHDTTRRDAERVCKAPGHVCAEREMSIHSAVRTEPACEGVVWL